MKLPTWFKVIWWIFITGGTGALFYSRIEAIAEGRTALVDIFIFLVLVVLLLVPIFQEISFFGLKFKQAIDDLKKQITTELRIFKADIQTTISNTSNVNVTIPRWAPPDEQLPDLERRIRTTITEALREEGITPPALAAPVTPDVDDNTLFLFKTRHAMEKTLRNLASLMNLPSGRAFPINRLSGILVEVEVLNPKIAQAIREIYGVCSPAIHGDPVTDAQVKFVRDLAPQVLDALNEIERRIIETS